MSLSKIVISGTVTKPPEKRFVNEVAVADFGLLVELPRKADEPPDTMALKVTVWRDIADRCIAEVHKNDRVTVDGRLQVNNYTDKDGNKHRQLEIQAVGFEVQRAVAPASTSGHDLDVIRGTRMPATAPPPVRKSPSDVDLDTIFASEDEIPF